MLDYKSSNIFYKCKIIFFLILFINVNRSPIPCGCCPHIGKCFIYLLSREIGRHIEESVFAESLTENVVVFKEVEGRRTTLTLVVKYGKQVGPVLHISTSVGYWAFVST